MSIGPKRVQVQVKGKGVSKKGEGVVVVVIHRHVTVSILNVNSSEQNEETDKKTGRGEKKRELNVKMTRLNEPTKVLVWLFNGKYFAGSNVTYLKLV